MFKRATNNMTEEQQKVFDAANDLNPDTAADRHNAVVAMTG